MIIKRKENIYKKKNAINNNLEMILNEIDDWYLDTRCYLYMVDQMVLED